jgi:hypothetical protein
MTSHSEFANKGRERPPSLLACITCRKKHIRCDAQLPVCGRCAYRKLPCVYTESKRGYHDRKKQSEAKAVTLEVGGEGPRGIADARGECLSGDSTPAPFTWPVAIPDGAVAADITTASPAESIARSTCFDRGQRDEVSHYSADLVDVFYSSFFPAHGFVVPRKLLLQSPKSIPEELKAVFRFVGSHFQHTQFQGSLREAAFRITDQNAQIDPGFKVQGLLCLAMVSMAGRLERALGMSLLHEAIDIALRIGLHRRNYAASRPADHPIQAESWRRTYWDLYVVDTLLSALDGSKYTSRLHDVAADLPLPGHDDDYINCRVQLPAPTMAEMADRVFAETPFNYSSGAYKVEATRIMRKVLALEADSFNVTNAQVETIDASIQSFLLSLPPLFREVVEHEGKVDEVLFTTHMIIHWASIALHRPRSNLTFLRNHYRTACSSEEPISMPALSFQSHAAKAIRAANAISKLTAIQTAPALHTPCFACVIALSATVHLPAYTMQSNQSEIKERLHLSVSALAAIGEVWPLASTVRAQVAQFARETFKAAAVSAPEDLPAIAEAPQGEDFDLENMVVDDSWLNELDAFALMPLPMTREVEQTGWS